MRPAVSYGHVGVLLVSQLRKLPGIFLLWASLKTSSFLPHLTNGLEHYYQVWNMLPPKHCASFLVVEVQGAITCYLFWKRCPSIPEIMQSPKAMTVAGFWFFVGFISYPLRHLDLTCYPACYHLLMKVWFIWCHQDSGPMMFCAISRCSRLLWVYYDRMKERENRDLWMNTVVYPCECELLWCLSAGYGKEHLPDQ